VIQFVMDISAKKNKFEVHQILVVRTCEPPAGLKDLRSNLYSSPCCLICLWLLE
jgi:hypothetical protein